MKTAEFDIIYGKGISQAGCLLDLGVEKGIIDKSGSWFIYNGEKFANGKEKARDYVTNNPEFAVELENKIRSIAFAGKDDGEVQIETAENK